jgi:protein subunit release factor A
MLIMHARMTRPRLRPNQVVEQADADAGGLRAASASVGGRGAYGALKFESGTHRVQRVPATESSGRVHTSAASVAVLLQPEEARTPLFQSSSSRFIMQPGGGVLALSLGPLAHMYSAARGGARTLLLWDPPGMRA